MIGGALIVIALLLVCGPLEGQFGGGQPGIDAVETTPDVAAVPPVIEAPEFDPTPATEAATTGVLMGAAVGESDLANPLAAQPVDALPIVPAPVSSPKAVAPALAPSAPVKVAKAPAPKAVRADPPPVAAAGPSPSELAAKDFDSSLADATNALDRDDANVVNRFAPPVDSGPRVTLAAQGFNAFALRPCDTPGAACQNAQPRQRSRPTPAAGGSVIPTP